MRFWKVCGPAAAALLSCAPDEIVIWSMPSGAGSGGVVEGAAGSTGESGAATSGAGGTGGSDGVSGGSAGALNTAASGGEGGEAGGCSSNDDCPISWLCVKPDCQSQSGVCEPRPVFCPAEPAPVCGCDQVTYWNDCVRRQSGAPAATAGECRSNAMPCDTSADCGVASASCARFVPRDEPCDPKAPGVCWVAPDVCEPGVEPLRWRACGPNAPEPAPCMDTCRAIVEECPVAPLHHDAECN